MADLPAKPGSNGDTDGDSGVETGVRLSRGSAPSTPRWVKVFGIFTLALVLLVVILLLFGVGPGRHGPSRHTSSGDTGVQTTLSSVTESGGTGGRRPPSGGHPR